MTSADDVIRILGLIPHPEGGHFRETFRDPTADSDRAASTAIYFLLRDGEMSKWHSVDAAEVWHFYAGAPLELTIADGESPWLTMTLGSDLVAGQRPQGIVPPYHWQRARSLGAWTLVGCTVAPGFEFEGFEISPAGWQPPESAADDADAG